jgi:hypothetical protein
MSRIHFVGGEKGGVGKSVVARLLAQHFVDQALPFAGVDGEPFGGALVRHYREFSHSVDLSAPESADQIMDRALGAERRVLVDLPAQSARALHEWLDSASVLEFATEMAIGLTFWHVCDGGFLSVSDIERSLVRLGSRVEHVVVKNLGRSRDFTQFEESDTKRLLDTSGGRTITLPELDPATMYKIDRLGLSFWAAGHLTEGDSVLKPLERQRVKGWLERAYAEFATLQGVI